MQYTETEKVYRTALTPASFLRRSASLFPAKTAVYVTTDRVRVVNEEMNNVSRDAETMGEVARHDTNAMKGYQRIAG